MSFIDSLLSGGILSLIIAGVSLIVIIFILIKLKKHFFILSGIILVGIGYFNNFDLILMSVGIFFTVIWFYLLIKRKKKNKLIAQQGTATAQNIAQASRGQTTQDLTNIRKERTRSILGSAKLYHAFRSNPIDTLKSIARAGVIFPKGYEQDEFTELYMEILDHVARKKPGILVNQLKNIKIGEYLEKNSNDKSLTSLPGVKRYIEDSKFREAMIKFSADTIGDQHRRNLVNFFYRNEEQCREGFADEAYMEVFVPRERVIVSGAWAFVVGPIPAKNITKIVLSKKYEKYIQKIQKIIDKKRWNIVLEYY